MAAWLVLPGRDAVQNYNYKEESHNSAELLWVAD